MVERDFWACMYSFKDFFLVRRMGECDTAVEDVDGSGELGLLESGALPRAADT